MPSMITKCPGCGRNGIMSKTNGLCFHCNKGATPAKVEPVKAAPAALPPPVRAKIPPGRSSMRVVRGRPAR